MYQKSVLENHIRVITESMPECRSIAMGFLLDAGLKDEKSGKYGVAHIAEHMMFQGTHTRDASRIAKFMDESGGYTGAFTARDYTCYTATVLDDYRTYALELMGDILLNSVFPSDRLEKEKKVIRREIDAAHDNPDQRAEDNLKAFIWGNHPLGRRIAGQAETVRSIERDDVIDFVRSNYLSHRLIIAAAGHVNHPDFIGQVQDVFWKMSVAGSERFSFQNPDNPVPVFSSGVTIEYAPVSQAYFSIGIRACPFADDLRYAMHILNNVLGGGVSSRMFCRLREEFGLVYDIGSEYQAYRDDGILIIKGSTTSQYLMQALELTLIEIGKLISGQDPVTEDELWKTKMNLRGQHMISSESTHTRMSRLMTQELYFGRHISTEDIMSRIDGAGMNDLEKICRNRLIHALQEMSLAIVGPETEADYNQASVISLLDNFKKYHVN